MEDRRAFVTGASEGIGREFVRRLAQEGFRTTSVARNEARLASLVEELGDTQHDYFVADLSLESDVLRCAERLKDGAYQVLVNNAGYGHFGRFSGGDAREEQRMLDVNCRASLALAHAFLSEARPGSALINLSSVTTYLPTPIQPTYCATKAFLSSLSESLWYQERARGVYVQALCPGLTRTKFMERAGQIGHERLLNLFTQTPEQVVDTSLRAMRRRRGPIVIPGFRNRLIAFVTWIFPRRWTVWASGRVGELSGIDH